MTRNSDRKVTSRKRAVPVAPSDPNPVEGEALSAKGPKVARAARRRSTPGKERSTRPAEREPLPTAPELSALLELARWDALSDPARVLVAEAVAARLPGFRFLELYRGEQGASRHIVAGFLWVDAPRGAPSVFLLIPGGTFVLGYDRGDPGLVSGAMREEWERSYSGYSSGVTIDGFLDHYLTPLRTVTVAPFLICRDYLTGYVSRPVLEISGGKTSVDVKRRKMTGLLAGFGFRLPTSDEWEIACSAGARTLYRWGPDAPLRPDPQAISTFQEHRRQNAFGLLFPANTYDSEMVAEPHLLRGGDGGNAICGAATPLVAWLALASAYAEPIVPGMPIFRGCFRPVISVPLD